MSRNQARDDRRKRELQRLQLAAARQQAEIAQQVDKSPSERIKPVVGMPADVVLTLEGYRRKDAIKRPERWGWNRLGLIMKWFYADLTLTLKRTERGGPYVVTEVEEVPEIENNPNIYAGFSHDPNGQLNAWGVTNRAASAPVE